MLDVGGGSSDVMQRVRCWSAEVSEAAHLAHWIRTMSFVSDGWQIYEMLVLSWRVDYLEPSSPEL